ncbi:uncharacterized protein LOC143690733 [Tamandua tetradactyla]|uniref:uncharacterized protein LOC143690733 n=1 Tax=Tamandua tetradactyla TaxID=48850 RepID=UPI004053ED19
MANRPSENARRAAERRREGAEGAWAAASGCRSRGALRGSPAAASAREETGCVIIAGRSRLARRGGLGGSVSASPRPGSFFPCSGWTCWPGLGPAPCRTTGWEMRLGQVRPEQEGRSSGRALLVCPGSAGILKVGKVRGLSEDWITDDVLHGCFLTHGCCVGSSAPPPPALCPTKLTCGLHHRAQCFLVSHSV